MQIIATTHAGETTPIGVGGRPVMGLYQQLARVIANRTRDEDCGTFLAEPTVDQATGTVTWYTPLDGEVQRLRQLAGPAREQADARLDRIVANVARVIDDLDAAGGREQRNLADNLRAALKHPSDADVYLVGGKPVLVNWAAESGNAGSAPMDLMGRLRMAPPPAAAAPAPLAPPPVAAPTVVVAERKRRLSASALGWGLALLALAALLAFLGWQWWKRPAVPLENLLTDEIGLRKEIDVLRRQLFDARAVCATCAPEEPPAPPPEPPPPPPPPPPEPVAEAPPPPEEPPEEQVTQLDAPPTCPVENPAELLVVLDTSGSMLYQYDADPRIEQRLLAIDEELRNMDATNPLAALLALGRMAELQSEAENLQYELERGSGPDRISVAKRAATDIVDAMPPIVDTALVTFAGCGQYRHAGPYSAADREVLKRQILGIQPEGGTPLGGTLAALPSLTQNGRSGDAPVNIVVISDGKDSCGVDPCAAARQLKQQMPYAVVSVVAASQNIGALSCIAEETQGLFLPASSASDLERAVRQASGRELPEECKK